jgi:cytochrome c553
MRSRSLLAFLVVVALGSATSVGAEKHLAELDQSKAFLTAHCVSCHGNEKSKGDHNFEMFNGKDWANHELLNELLTVLKEKEMPPKKAKNQPSAKELAGFEKLLAKQYFSIQSKLPGVLTRLNRAEYENTINDAFFTKLEVKNHLPVDNTRDGFDNEGDKLVMSPFAMDSYFRVGSGIAEKVVGGMPGTSTTHHSYDNGLGRRLGSDGVAPYERGNDGMTTEGYRYNDASAGLGFKYGDTVPGYYDVKVNGHFTFIDPTVAGAFLKERDLYFKVDLGKENERLRITTNIDPKLSKKALSTQDFLLSDKVRIYLEPGQNAVLYSYNYFYPLPKDLSKLKPIPSLPADKAFSRLPKALLHFISADVTGPYYDSWPPKNEFYNTYYEDLKDHDPHKKYQQFIRKLAVKLFRRPVSDGELTRFFDVAKKRYETDKNVLDAVQSALTMMLCSPKFLYKYEGDSLNLDDYAIASRLSYFLWNTLPDDRLIKLASEGKLKDASVRSAEALRMLEDPRSQRFVTDFTEQWLELHKIDVVNPQAEILKYTFKGFTDLRPFMGQESIEFFKVILDENLSLLNFIDSDFVVINRPLNGIYKLELPEEEKLSKGSDLKERDRHSRRQRAFRKVMLDKESRRGGLLTQAGILMMNTNGEFTNPFYRGAWVAESIYGLELKLPANLEIEALNAPTETFTIKDTINEHRNNPICASCHSKMDPFGLALENFDVFGRWRDTYSKFVVTKTTIEVTAEGKTKKTEKTERKFEPTTKVDASTVHRDGRPVAGIEGLKKLMLEDQDKIAENVLTKLSEYAMGRKMNYADSEMVHRLLAASRKNDYKLRDLMVSFIADESFTKR